MKTVTTTMFEAFDGKLFEEAKDCHNYECDALYKYMENHKGSFYGGDGANAFSDGLSGDDIVCPFFLDSKEDRKMLALARDNDEYSDIPSDEELDRMMFMGSRARMIVMYADNDVFDEGDEYDYMKNKVVPTLQSLLNDEREHMADVLEWASRYVRYGLGREDK